MQPMHPAACPRPLQACSRRLLASSGRAGLPAPAGTTNAARHADVLLSRAPAGRLELPLPYLVLPRAGGSKPSHKYMEQQLGGGTLGGMVGQAGEHGSLLQVPSASLAWPIMSFITPW